MSKTEQSQEDRVLTEVSKQIQEILESNDLALQPFLAGYPYSITPQIRLVSTKEDEQGPNQEETGGDTEEVESTDAS